MLWSARGRLAAVQARVGAALGARVGIEWGSSSVCVPRGWLGKGLGVSLERLFRNRSSWRRSVPVPQSWCVELTAHFWGGGPQLLRRGDESRCQKIIPGVRK